MLPGCLVWLVRRRARHLACPFTGWRPPVPSGPLYSRKRTSHAPRPFRVDHGVGIFAAGSRSHRYRIACGSGILPRSNPRKPRQEPPRTRDNDDWGMWAGGTFAGIKRTEGSHPVKVSPARRPRAQNSTPGHFNRLKILAISPLNQ